MWPELSLRVKEQAMPLSAYWRRELVLLWKETSRLPMTAQLARQVRLMK
jgi:hypothetical protein